MHERVFISDGGSSRFWLGVRTSREQPDVTWFCRTQKPDQSPIRSRAVGCHLEHQQTEHRSGLMPVKQSDCVCSIPNVLGLRS